MFKGIDEILDLVDSPEDQIGLGDVLKNLKCILPLLHEIDSKQWPKLYIKELVSCCKEELSKKNHPSNYHFIEKTERGGLSKYKKSNPLYSTLWTKPPSSYNPNSFYHLQAHLINSIINFKSVLREEENLEPSIYQSSLSIRKISTKIEFQNILSDIPVKPYETEIFHGYISTLLNKKYKGLKTPLNDIERMLAYTYGDRNPHSKHTKNEQSYIDSFEKELLEIDSESEINPEPIELIHTSNLSKKEAGEARNEGNSGSENFSGPKITTEAKPLDQKSGETPVIRALAMKKKIRGLSRYNQQLPMRWDRLNEYEILSLYVNLKILLNNNYKNISVEKQDSLLALIIIMHWTASPTERALSTIILKNVNNIPDTCPENSIYLCLEERLWVIAKPNLEQRKMRTKWKGHFEKSINSIQLPLNPLCWDLIKNHVNKTASGLNLRSKLFVTNEKDKLEEMLRDFISSTNKKFHSRLTQIRISSHIYDLLIDQTGDAADAALITGRIPNRGQKTALYYYSPLANYLQAEYIKTCMRVEKAITDKIKFNQSSYKNKEVCNYNKVRIGSKICPIRNVVQLMVFDLQAKVNNYKKNHLDEDHLIQFHNAYTAYSVMMIGFATGYRAVRDPFYSESEIDEETSFLVISDKDSDDYYNSRLVWLPQVCRNQISFYSKYRLFLAEKLILTNLELAKKLLKPDLYSWSQPKKNEDQLPFFFFLKDFYKNKPVRPISLHEMTDWITDIPLNANRHYLRTHLREQGVSADYVDSFMGHWDSGQEPYGEYSTLSPLSFIHDIKAPLEKLLDDAGWKAIKGTYA